MTFNTISQNRSFGGVQGVYEHHAQSCNCTMTFGLFLPPQAQVQKVPLLWYLSGLTCTHENAMVKSGAQKWAAELGLAVIFPDTSPRGEGVADDPSYALGQGAGFYVNATEAPWAPHFQMESYITEELPTLLFNEFALDADKQAITGHSMGGHGALTLAAKNPSKFSSVSAFSPICNPSASDWGQPQFTAYLGEDETAWQEHDASVLIAANALPMPMLVDVGLEDNFWDLLCIPALANAMSSARQEGMLRLQKGYDHSYFFVSSFIPDHLRFHAENFK